MNKKQKYIIRTDRAGVFYGEIKERRGDEADLINVRRIYRWAGATETLQLAKDGAQKDGTKMTVQVDEMTVLGILQINPCTEKAVESFEAQPVWKF